MLMTPAQAASAAGVPRARIYAWIRTGRLPALRIGERAIRIAPADLERALAEPSPLPSRPRTKPPRRHTDRKAPRQRPPNEEVIAWIEDFYRRYDRIPPRDEIWRAFQGLTKVDAERYLRDARSRLWSPDP